VGKLKGLAVSSADRLSALPQVPTANEAGLKGFALDSWFALYAPAGTPPEIVAQLNTEIGKILANPDVKKKAEDAGTSVETMTPAQLGEYTKKELDAWGKVIKNANITAD
jgi:tripartite-type tricarboxylate transporter receptor subunit TctC